MNYGMIMSASGILTSMYRQDVAANNLANLNTTAFRPTVSVTRARDAVRQEDGVFNLPSNTLLERLGAGVLLAPNRMDNSPGPLEKTDRPLDVAINGEGFFVVSSGQGTDAERYRFTRDGRFTVGPRGHLVQAATGLPVLDESDRPVDVGDGVGVTIDAAGQVVKDGVAIAKLQVVRIPSADRLLPMGDGLLRADVQSIQNREPAPGAVVPGHIEGSAVDPVSAMMQVTGAGLAVAANSRMIQLHDELMGRAITALGRVA